MRMQGPTKRGLALIECMAYIAVLSLIMGLGFGAFIKAVERTTRLDRKATQIVQAVQAGERWRADIRSAARSAEAVQTAAGPELRLHTGSNAIAYAFRDGMVLRQAGDGAPWLPFLEQVKASRFDRDQRQMVTGWRWEVELASGHEEARLRPVFTFQAVIER